MKNSFPQVNYLKISLITAHFNLSKQQRKEFQKTEVPMLLVRVKKKKSNNNVKSFLGGSTGPLLVGCGMLGAQMFPASES